MLRRVLSAHVLVALLCFGSSALAQGRGGFGRPQGYMLLTNKSVQTELKLSDEQTNKVTAVLAEIQAKHNDELQSLRDIQDIQERMKKSREIGQTIQQEAKKPVSELLSADQMKRFQQIDRQVRGIDAFNEADVQAELKITDSQKGQFKDLMDSRNEKRREVFQSANGDREVMRTKMLELTKEFEEKAMGILSADQKKAWKEMLGEPFKLVIEPRNN